jgi:6-phosphogluconolactonase
MENNVSSEFLSLDTEYNLLVGTYSDLDALAHQPHAPSPGIGIYGLKLSADGHLSAREQIESLNPAVLIPHPEKPVMYAILETIQTNGSIQRYEVGDGGTLAHNGTFNASGKSTCYLSLSPKRDSAVVINYWDAMIDVVDVDGDGQLGDIIQSFKQHYRVEGDWRQVATREDHWANRQVGPHAHCAHFWKGWVFIPDLGENAVFQYRYDETSKQLTPDLHIEFEAGSGPRHMAMHPTLDVCYISNELFNTVCVASLDSSDPGASKPRLLPIQYESTLENRDQVSYVSEIKLSPDARFLYVSNRGDNSLAIFKVLTDGKLERIALVPTGGKFPRHFAITPCGKAVIVANQDSSTLRLFSRDIDSGLLTDVGYEYSVPAPNYIRFY